MTPADRSKKWRQNNKEWRSDAGRELKNERQREYYHNNKAKHRAYYRVKQNIPLTKEQSRDIELIYSAARALGLTVDHVWPLRGRNSCGLHVPWNLQLLTQRDNDQKANKEPIDY